MCANPRRVRPIPRFALTSGIARRLKSASAPGDTAKEGSANSAADHLKVRSCLIDGEAVACDKNGLAVFERLRRRPSGKHVSLYAFDLLELDGQDLRREPLETRKCRPREARPLKGGRRLRMVGLVPTNRNT